MTDLLERPIDVNLDTINIQEHPAVILDTLGQLALSEPDRDDGKLLVTIARQQLAHEALVEHKLALMIIAETGEEAPVPSAITVPTIVGAETIYSLVQERKKQARGIRPDPMDETKHLITIR
jgi:hypothetical protein